MLLTVRTLAALALLAATTAGCLPAGYGACQNDNECPLRDGGKLICYNAHCVECRYDDNCPAGSACTSNHVCQALHTPEKEPPPAPPPTSLEECTQRCKGNQACVDGCRQQLK